LLEVVGGVSSFGTDFHCSPDIRSLSAQMTVSARREVMHDWHVARRDLTNCFSDDRTSSPTPEVAISAGPVCASVTEIFAERLAPTTRLVLRPTSTRSVSLMDTASSYLFH